MPPIINTRGHADNKVYYGNGDDIAKCFFTALSEESLVEVEKKKKLLNKFKMRETLRSEKSRKVFNLVLITVLMLVVAIFFWLVFPEERDKLIIEVGFVIIGTLFALFFTFEIFYPRYLNVEKYRLMEHLLFRCKLQCLPAPKLLNLNTLASFSVCLTTQQ